MEPKGLHSPDNPSEPNPLLHTSSDFLLQSDAISFSQSSHSSSSLSGLIDPSPPIRSAPSLPTTSPPVLTRPRALTAYSAHPSASSSSSSSSTSSSHPLPLSVLRSRSATIANPTKSNIYSSPNVSSTTAPSTSAPTSASASTSSSTSTSTSTATSPTATTTNATTTTSTTSTSAASSTTTSAPASTPAHHPSEGREKRKRSRVTPEQLSHLERLFAMDRSPTAAKRKEISELLGMQERQTQIWFQNRRAKAKTLEGKGKLGFRDSPHSGGDSPPPGTPSDYTHPPVDIDLHTLIHEDDPAITFLPCTDLTIGSWRRISATLGQHDLLAYVSYAKQCFTWFIYSNGYGFKMEIPFDSITNTAFASTAAGQAIASFYLTRPPVFFLEAAVSPTAAADHIHADPNDPPPPPAVSKLWKKCADWTEGQQASKILRHDLVGAPGPLMTALKSLHTVPSLSPLSASSSSSSSSVPSALSAPVSTTAPPITTMMHIPQPPLTAIDAAATAATAHATTPFDFHMDAPHFAHGRKRSSSGPPNYSLLGAGAGSQQSDTHQSNFGPNHPRSLTFANPYPHPPVSFFRTFSSTAGAISSVASSSSSSAAVVSSSSSSSSSSSAPSFSHSHHHMSSTPSTTMEISSPISDYTTVPISHAIAPRPYSASSSMSLSESRLRYTAPSSAFDYHHHPHQHYPRHHNHLPTSAPSSIMPTFRAPSGSIFRSNSPALLTAAFDPSTLHKGASMSGSASASIMHHQASHHLAEMDTDMVSGGNIPSDSGLLSQIDMDMTDPETAHFSSGISQDPALYDGFTSLDSTLPEPPLR